MSDNDIVDRLREGVDTTFTEPGFVAAEELMDEAANAIDALRANVADAVGIIGRQNNEIETLKNVLRMVAADRPTAHSDRVWAAIIDALAEP